MITKNTNHDQQAIDGHFICLILVCMIDLSIYFSICDGDVFTSLAKFGSGPTISQRGLLKNPLSNACETEQEITVSSQLLAVQRVTCEPRLVRTEPFNPCVSSWWF